jgi:hypothetical protein
MRLLLGKIRIVASPFREGDRSDAATFEARDDPAAGNIDAERKKDRCSKMPAYNAALTLDPTYSELPPRNR